MWRDRRGELVSKDVSREAHGRLTKFTKGDLAAPGTNRNHGVVNCSTRAFRRLREYDLIAEWYASVRVDQTGVPETAALASSIPRGSRVLDIGCGNGIPITGVLLRAGHQSIELTVPGPCSNGFGITALKRPLFEVSFRLVHSPTAFLTRQLPGGLSFTSAPNIRSGQSRASRESLSQGLHSCSRPATSTTLKAKKA